MLTKKVNMRMTLCAIKGEAQLLCGIDEKRSHIEITMYQNEMK